MSSFRCSSSKPPGSRSSHSSVSPYRCMMVSTVPDEPPLLVGILCDVCKELVEGYHFSPHKPNADDLGESWKRAEVQFPSNTLALDYTVREWMLAAQKGCVTCAFLLDHARMPWEHQQDRRALKLIEGGRIVAKCGSVRLIQPYQHYFRLQDGSGLDIAEVYARKAELVKYVNLDNSTGSKMALDFAKTWLRNCILNHTHDSISESRRAPTRLIKVCDGVCHLSKRPSKPEVPCPSYATLSHCWGHIDLFKLTKENIASLHEHIPVDRLCKTFKDAIQVIRHLEIDYIWIDSMCIIQDDSDDWDRESAMMAGVYGDATVNIAASSAKDGSFGLFSERKGGHLERKYFSTSIGTIYELFHSGVPEQALGETALSKRAWAFQERFLAQRTIDFTADQIFAECHQHIVCEAWPEGIPGDDKKLHPLLPSFPDRRDTKDWHLVVQHYLKGQLTYPKDIFPALSGVARFFQKRLEDRYVAGVWLKRLPWQLCWKCQDSTQQQVSLSSTAIELPYRAPSWSWASVYVPISWSLYSTHHIGNESETKYLPVIEILDIKLIPLGSDTLGQLREAGLHLKCYSIIKHSQFHSIIRFGEVRSYWFRKDEQILVPTDTGKIWQGKIQYDQDNHTDELIQTSYLLPLLTYTGRPGRHQIGVVGLIIAPSSNSMEGEFMRVGVFDIIFEPFHSFYSLMEFFARESHLLMDESLYEQSLGLNADGIAKNYSIRLV